MSHPAADEARGPAAFLRRRFRGLRCADGSDQGGSVGNDTIDDGDGADAIEGGAGDNSFAGAAALDLIDGGAGADRIHGGLGNEAILGGPGDVLDGGEEPGDGDLDVPDLRARRKARTDIAFAPGDPEAGFATFHDTDGMAVIGTLSVTSIERLVPWFTPATPVPTDSGERAVEEIGPRDRALARDSGFRRVVRAGRRNRSAADLARDPALAPVRIRAGALGPRVPDCDPIVPPQHRLLPAGVRVGLLSAESEVLAPAVHLIGQRGVGRLAAPRPPRSLDPMCEHHQILRSAGAWSRSAQPGAAVLSDMDCGPRGRILALLPALAGGAIRPPASR